MKFPDKKIYHVKMPHFPNSHRNLTQFHKKLSKYFRFNCPFFRRSSQHRDWTQISHTAGRFFTSWATDQIRSVAQLCPTLCNPMNRSRPGLPVHHQLPEFTETHVHRVSDAIQPSHPLSSPSPPASNPSQHQSLFQWVKSSHEVAKVLEFQL